MSRAFEISAAGFPDLQGRLAQLGADMPKVMARALNRTIANVRAASVRALVTETGLPLARVRKSVEIERATWNNLVARQFVTGKRITLADFGAREVNKGVAYKLPTHHGFIPGAFLATMKSGHVGVFKREPLPSVKRSPGAWSLNLPIKVRRGPSLPFVLRNKGVLNPILAQANALLEKNLTHEIDFLVSQRTAASDAA